MAPPRPPAAGGAAAPRNRCRGAALTPAAPLLLALALALALAGAASAAEPLVGVQSDGGASDVTDGGSQFLDSNAVVVGNGFANTGTGTGFDTSLLDGGAVLGGGNYQVLPGGDNTYMGGDNQFLDLDNNAVVVGNGNGFANTGTGTGLDTSLLDGGAVLGGGNYQVLPGGDNTYMGGDNQFLDLDNTAVGGGNGVGNTGTGFDSSLIDGGSLLGGGNNFLNPPGVGDYVIKPGDDTTFTGGNEQGFAGHTYGWCEAGGGAHCLGRVFSVLSEPLHLFNARISRFPGPDTWPFAGAWMVAYGFRYRSILSVELELNTDITYSLLKERRAGDPSKESTRAALPADWRGVFASLRVNGADAAHRVGSGATLSFGGGAAAARVHFPSRRHAGDATDGPVVVITTPDAEITLYLESEEITHLDFSVTLVGGGITDMHGVLGQSLAWRRGAPAQVEGSDLDYALEGGLLSDGGTAFAFNRFGRPRAAGAAAPGGRAGRALKALAPPAPRTGGSVARA
ncbi:MAG: hypothetical protein J3K34DRAFT_502385 [Monoraphidium minutum]|nr:MAG: hypothetical protein J3K34DRAFT_502385 [Monoraphidium minutum]